MRNTQRYMSLPFNPKLKQRAKELRKAGMLHEALLWNQLKRKQFRGLDFDRQKIIGNYIVDFFCADKGVIIEADGASHQGREDYDTERDAYLKGLGLTVIRLDVKAILQDMGAVLTFLDKHPALMEEPPRQAAPATPPTEGDFQSSYPNPAKFRLILASSRSDSANCSASLAVSSAIFSAKGMPSSSTSAAPT